MNEKNRKKLVDFISRIEQIQTYSYFTNPENIIGFEMHRIGDNIGTRD